jgi:hypothetical protein
MNEDFRAQLKEIAELLPEFPPETRSSVATELIRALCEEWFKQRHGLRAMFDMRKPRPAAPPAAPESAG